MLPAVLSSVSICWNMGDSSGHFFTPSAVVKVALGASWQARSSFGVRSGSSITSWNLSLKHEDAAILLSKLGLSPARVTNGRPNRVFIGKVSVSPVESSHGSP